MPPVIAFDVNETLLDLSALDPLFERGFGDPGLRPLWFGQMLQLAFVGAITGRYVDFTTAQRAALSMLADRTGRELDPDMAEEIVDGMTRLPPHPEVDSALEQLSDSQLSTAALTNSPLEVAEAQLRHAGLHSHLAAEESRPIPARRRRKAQGERGGRKRSRRARPHAGAHRPLHPNPTRRRDVLAERCPHCQADVTGVAQVRGAGLRPHRDPRDHAGRDAGDAARRRLPAAAPDASRRRPPAGLEPGSPFGPNLRAFVLYLRFGQAIPFERLERLMRDLFGLEISEGALVNLLDDSAPAFEVQTEPDQATPAVRHRPAIRRDQRPRRQDDLLDLGLSSRRQRLLRHPALARQGGGPGVPRRASAPSSGFPTVSRAQMGWASKDHQVCLAHLLRDIQYAIDAGDAAFAPGMKALLKRAAAHRPPPSGPGRFHPGRLPFPAPDQARRTCSRSCRTPRPDRSSSGSSSASARTCSSSSPTATSRRPTTAPSRRCGPASSSARSPTASDPSGAPNSTPTSDPSLKPPDEDRSARSRPSASPSTACRYPWTA